MKNHRQLVTRGVAIVQHN